MKHNRLLAAALAAALTCGLSLPASAAPSSFEDITQDAVAVNADVLRLMGVVTGTGGNRFNPDGGLSRAEFCVMVTNFIQRGDEVSRYAARTIFSDVTGNHWARGYINLMATPGTGGAAMISGIGNGSFAPDQKVTVAQAVTVLLRVLNYTGKETGFIWPQSYMDFADTIGLTDGVSQDANVVLTRAQAAQLFVNALGCPTQGGVPYYKTLGSVAENTILLAVNVTSEDGSSNNAIRTSFNGESFLPAAGEVSPSALQGKRGALVLNEREEIVTFLPDESNSVTVTLSGNAQPSYFKGTNGIRYTLSSSTLLYTPDSPQGMNYIEGYTALRSGSQITLFTQSGKITAVYAAGSSNAAAGAVVVSGTASESSFYRLTGGASNYTAVKNGQTIPLSAIQAGDVVTYDRLNNTLIVSELRIRATLEDAYPNAQAPQTITALGIQFEVLSSAWENMDEVDIGDEVCLRFTADGKVAAIENRNSSNRSNAYGLAAAGGVEVFLPNGGTMLIPGTFSGTRALTGRLVELNGRNSRGVLDVKDISEQSISGSFDPTAMTLGKYQVAAGVRIFDQVKHSLYAPVDLSELSGQVVASSDIQACHLNSSGYIDCIILNNLTGKPYTYGICYRTETAEDFCVTLENGVNTGIDLVPTPITFQNGQFGGVAMGGDGKVKAIIALEKLSGISPADFFEMQGATYLEHNGTVYPVSTDVVCYKQVNKTWINGESGSARLAQCKAFSAELTAYCDPCVGQVRVVCAE